MLNIMGVNMAKDITKKIDSIEKSTKRWMYLHLYIWLFILIKLLNS